MRKIAVIGLLAFVAACSVEDPPQPVEPAPETAPPAVQEQEAQTEEKAAPATDPATASELAEAMDEAETAGMPEDASSETTIELADASSQPPTAPERFKQGIHYQLLTAAQPTGSAPGRVEVLEVFWYGCPHCYTLEPHLEAWVSDGMPSAGEFRRLPATLNPGWQIHARAYYTAEALGVLDQVHDDLFREVHVNRNPLNTPDALASFFEGYGVSEADFMEAFNSFAVQTKLRRSDALVRRYRITGVPAVVVNGKYVTGASEAGGVQQLFEVIGFLVEKEVARQ